MGSTVFALASGSGRTAVAVVRISGPEAGVALRLLAGGCPEPRRAVLRTLRDPATTEPLDRALVLWLPAPTSFTGEDVAELHLHGGRAVVAAVLQALARIEGLRSAEPGEFTRRAFRNGRMDLADVEGLADLIEADTQAQRRQALRQLDGALGRWARGMRQTLIDALALAEGAIDFAEDDDLVQSFNAGIVADLTRVRESVGTQIALAGRGEKLRQGLVVTIAGAPNVGKSTLLNALAGREVAIVSPYAGTTRDALEVELELQGQPVRLIDTAGLRETEDPIEREGIVRARARAADADLVLWLDDGTAASAASRPAQGQMWRVATKCDRAQSRWADADFEISAKTGAGLDRLLDALSAHAADSLSGGEGAVVTRVRHRAALEQAQACLDSALGQPDRSAFELVAEDLRRAIAALESLVGTVATEEVLGSIFARFCIGK